MKMQALENQKIRTATSRNGVALQMEIYHDRRAARKGYFLYMPAIIAHFSQIEKTF